MAIRMIIALLLVFPFCIMGQRYPDFFGNQDFKNFGLMHHRGNPNSLVRPYGAPYNKQNTERQNPYGITEKPFLDPYQFKDLYDELDLLDDRITRSNKWEEFKAFATQLREKAAENPNNDWHDDLRKILEWSRKLEKAPRPDQSRPMNLRNVESRPVINPSPGMSAYWGENEKETKVPFESRLPTPPPGIPRILSGYQLKELAVKKINGLRTMGGANAPITSLQETKYETQNPLPSINLQSTSLEPPKADNPKQNNNIVPQYDDFGSPIKWVPVTSNETRDGLAKITDPSSGRNREYIINGTIFVPVTDYSMERLGFTTTTTSAPVHTTDAAVLHTVTRNIDIKNAQQNDWLVFETVMGGRDEETECYGEGCQARCKKLGCDTSCSGDTCAAGCVASSCNSFCKGPGCFAMCVGEGCSAKCEGMSCDARCRGEGCETSCRRFSCTYTTNGKSSVGGGMWLEHYPQYDHANVKANY